MTTYSEPARLANRPEDYARLKLARGQVEPWEDGIRLDTSAPNLEWWYCDADLDDGTALCIIFATKDGTRPGQPLAPQLEIDLTLPDGTRLVRSAYFKSEEFSASKEGCDVRIGPYHFTGDLHEYRITGAADELWADVRLEGMMESWRPETGQETAEMLELSLRHARRLLADYRQAGAVALAHGCITAELNHNGADYRTNNQLLYDKDA